MAGFQDYVKSVLSQPINASLCAIVAFKCFQYYRDYVSPKRYSTIWEGLKLIKSKDLKEREKGVDILLNYIQYKTILEDGTESNLPKPVVNERASELLDLGGYEQLHDYIIDTEDPQNPNILEKALHCMRLLIKDEQHGTQERKKSSILRIERGKIRDRLLRSCGIEAIFSIAVDDAEDLVVRKNALRLLRTLTVYDRIARYTVEDIPVGSEGTLYLLKSDDDLMEGLIKVLGNMTDVPTLKYTVAILAHGTESIQGAQRISRLNALNALVSMLDNRDKDNSTRKNAIVAIGNIAKVDLQYKENKEIFYDPLTMKKILKLLKPVRAGQYQEGDIGKSDHAVMLAVWEIVSSMVTPKTSDLREELCKIFVELKPYTMRLFSMTDAVKATTRSQSLKFQRLLTAGSWATAEYQTEFKKMYQQTGQIKHQAKKSRARGRGGYGGMGGMGGMMGGMPPGMMRQLMGGR